jgi:DNA-binding SARP family transcriptional activator
MNLSLKPDAIWVDVNAFTALLSASNAHGHGPDTICDECAQLYQQAIELYRADFMERYDLPDSVNFEEWQLAQREWLRREWADLHRRLSDYYAQTQQHDRAIKHAQDWLASDVLHEPAHRQLMRLCAATVSIQKPYSSINAARNYSMWNW